MDYNEMDELYCRISEIICELDEIAEDVRCYIEEVDGGEMYEISERLSVFQDKIKTIMERSEDVDDEPDWYHDRLQEKLDASIHDEEADEWW